MVAYFEFRKCLNIPTVNSSHYLCPSIYASTADGNVTTDLFIAAAPKHLYCTGNAVSSNPLRRKLIIHEFVHKAAGKTQAWVPGKARQKHFEVFGSKRYICIQIRDVIIGHRCELFVSSLKRSHF